MRKNGEIMFTGHRDENNMFIANITRNTITAHSNEVNNDEYAVKTSSDTSDSLRDYDANEQCHECDIDM